MLFGQNVVDPDQVRRLVAELRRRSHDRLRIAVDQEGGHIVRLGAPLTRFPSAMAVAATRSPRLAREVARASGLELAALGIDTVLAPVLDLAADPWNPTLGARTFGSDPELVAKLGAAALAGYREAGVAATAKHFPGHGRTPIDSHLGQPVVEGGIRALRRRDLVPFRAARRAPIVMTAHVVYRGLGGSRPATVAQPILALARDEIGFNGVLLTDAMWMDAITATMRPEEASVRALAAGADVVMPLRGQWRAMASIESAIRDGTLAEQRVAAALRRIRALQRSHPGPPPIADLARLTSRYEPLADEVARRSLTLAWGGELLPLEPGALVGAVELGSSRKSPVEDETGEGPLLGLALERRFPRVLAERIVPGSSTSAAARQRALALAARADVLLIATRDAFTVPAELPFLASLASAARRVVHVALRSPSDLVLLPGADAGLAVYTDVPASLAALADGLAAGRSAFPGALPMAIPDAVPEGLEAPAA